MNISSGTHIVGSESIYYEKSIIEGTQCRTPILHGAGQSDMSRTIALRDALYKRGIPTLALDFSGHGQSSHHTVGSIMKRIEEATEIGRRFLDIETSIQIIGFSMSGEVAIRLIRIFDISNIILFAPGIYDDRAIRMPFGPAFAEILHTHESWRHTKIGEFLGDYRGSLSLIVPEYDRVIPNGVNDIIMESAPLADKQKIIVTGAEHMMGKWMNENLDRIDEFIDSLKIL